jgi:hypothetical protein
MAREEPGAMEMDGQIKTSTTMKIEVPMGARPCLRARAGAEAFPYLAHPSVAALALAFRDKRPKDAETQPKVCIHLMTQLWKSCILSGEPFGDASVR